MKRTVYPPADEVFAWTRMTDIKDVSCRIVVCLEYMFIIAYTI